MYPLAHPLFAHFSSLTPLPASFFPTLLPSHLLSESEEIATPQEAPSHTPSQVKSMIRIDSSPSSTLSSRSPSYSSISLASHSSLFSTLSKGSSFHPPPSIASIGQVEKVVIFAKFAFVPYDQRPHPDDVEEGPTHEGSIEEPDTTKGLLVRRRTYPPYSPNTFDNVSEGVESDLVLFPSQYRSGVKGKMATCTCSPDYSDSTTTSGEGSEGEEAAVALATVA